MRVKNLVMGKQTLEVENVEELIKIANKKKVNVIMLEAGDVANFDKYTKMVTLWPNLDYIVSDNEINNMSLVFTIESKGKKILFSGDIEKAGEDAILRFLKTKKNDNNIVPNLSIDDLKADILKVAHHGSKSSSTQSFIKAVNPEVCLIGVGEDNRFGHPSSEVLDALDFSQIYRTDLLGEIKFSY